MNELSTINDLEDMIRGYVDTTLTDQTGLFHPTGPYDEIFRKMQEIQQQPNQPVIVPTVTSPNTIPWTPLVPNQQFPGNTGPSRGYKILTPAVPAKSIAAKPARSHQSGPSETYAEAIDVAVKMGFSPQKAQRARAVGTPQVTEYFWTTDGDDFTVYMTYVDSRDHHGNGDESLNFSLIGGDITNPTSSLIQLDGVPPERITNGLSQVISGLILARRALDIGTGFSA